MKYLYFYLLFLSLLGIIFGMRWFKTHETSIPIASQNTLWPEFFTLSKRASEHSAANHFGTLLFFTGWAENSYEAGNQDFIINVKPSLDFAVNNKLTPIITWEPMNKNIPELDLSLKTILAGESDLYINGWSQALHTWLDQHPNQEVRIRLMHEMNAPITDYHWAGHEPELYKQAYAYIYERVHTPENPNLTWMVVFQNLTADQNWKNKRAADYLKFLPEVPIDYIGIDGYSRPFLEGKDGPPGGEVTPEQVLPEQFFAEIRAHDPVVKIVVSETSVPYMTDTDELIPYPASKPIYYMKDQERALWLNDLSSHLLKLHEKYTLTEVTWFNGNTDYHWSLTAPEDVLTKKAFFDFMSIMQKASIKVGLYPG